MSIGPEEAAEAARETLSGVAAGVAGQDVAGVYGDPAGASVRDAPQSQEEIAADLAAKGGQAAVADVDALQASVQALAAQLAALQEQANARAEADKVAEEKPASLLETLGSSSVGSQVAHLFTLVEGRLAALEGKS